MMDINPINVDYFDLNIENAKYADLKLIFGRREEEKKGQTQSIL